MAAAAAFSAATSTAKAAAASKFGRLTDKATKKPINWVDYNWPTRHCGCNLLHLPPWSELREFSETTYLTVWTLYVTFCGVLAVTCVNLLSSIVLAATVPGAYPAANVLYSVLNIVIGGVVSTTAWFKALSGLAEHSNQGKWIAKAAIAFMIVAGLVQAFAGFANVNGFANLASQRLEDAREEDSGAAGYWTAMSIIEPLLWLATVGGFGFGGYRLAVA